MKKIGWGKKWLVCFVISAVLAVCSVGTPVIHASEDAHDSHVAPDEHGGDEHGGGEHGGGEHGGGEHGDGEHGDGHGGGHHEPAPGIYYFVWLVTLIIAVVTILGWRGVRKAQDQAHEHGHEHHPPEFAGTLKIMGIFLISAVFLLFFAEGFLHWHEPNGLGVLRTLVKGVAGVSLMFWGIAFMHHEEEEDDDDGHGGGHGHEDSHGHEGAHQVAHH